MPRASGLGAGPWAWTEAPVLLPAARRPRFGRAACAAAALHLAAALPFAWWAAEVAPAAVDAVEVSLNAESAAPSEAEPGAVHEPVAMASPDALPATEAPPEAAGPPPPPEEAVPVRPPEGLAAIAAPVTPPTMEAPPPEALRSAAPPDELAETLPEEALAAAVPPPPPPMAAPPPPRSAPPRPAPSRQASSAREAAEAPATAPSPALSPAPPAAPSTALARAAVSRTPSQGYVGALLAALERHKEYPAQARYRRAEGIALLRFSLRRDGSVSAWRIERTSGDHDLDAAVGQMLRRATPLPPPPADLAGDPIELVVPVRFTLR